MRVGILGSELMGGKLGTLFARADHEVVFSFARSKEKLSRLAQDARGPTLEQRHAFAQLDRRGLVGDAECQQPVHFITSISSG